MKRYVCLFFAHLVYAASTNRPVPLPRWHCKNASQQQPPGCIYGLWAVQYINVWSCCTHCSLQRKENIVPNTDIAHEKLIQFHGVAAFEHSWFPNIKLWQTVVRLICFMHSNSEPQPLNSICVCMKTLLGRRTSEHNCHSSITATYRVTVLCKKFLFLVLSDPYCNCMHHPMSA